MVDLTLMTKNILPVTTWLQTSLIRLCKIHLILTGIYGIYIAASNATNLVIPQVIQQRLIAGVLLAIGVGLVWNFARGKNSASYYRRLVYVLILLDIAFAAFSIYTQRGMASRGVMLFGLPIVVSAILLSNKALYVTAALCMGVYSMAATKYFLDYFNEGYRAELIIEVGFYCAVFIILASILSILVNREKAR